MFKKLVAAIMLCSFAVLFTTCAKKTAAEPVTITLMHGWNGTGFDHVAMRSIFDDFQKLNPDIKLLYDASPDIDIVIKKAQDMLAVDKMPDIISTNNYAGLLNSAVKKGLALDLRPYIEQDEEFYSNINPLVLNAWKNEDGSIYTVPDVLEHMGYWYNESILQQAGITQDGTANTPVKLPQTWEDFWNVCKTLSEIQDETGALPIILQPKQINFLLGVSLAASDGSARKMMQRIGNTCTAEEANLAVEEIKNAFVYINQSTTIIDAWQMFFEGKSAIYLNGAWANTERLQTGKKQNIKYATFPSYTNESVAYVSPPTGYVVSNKCTDAQKEAAVRFIKYMVSEDVQKRIVAETKQAPSNPKITAKWISEFSPALAQAISTCYSADVKIISISSIYNEKAINEMLSNWQQMIMGEDVSDKLISIITDKSQLNYYLVEKTQTG